MSENENEDVSTPVSRRREKHQQSQEKEKEKETNFSCHICFDQVNEPVLTSCGHLFCWPCIYQWMETLQERGEERTCPVCKSLISTENLIPIYGHGDSKKNTDPRTRIPQRPPQQRIEPEQQPQQNRYGTFFETIFGAPHVSQRGNFQFSAGIGPFPGFGISFGQNIPPNTGPVYPSLFQNPHHQSPQSPEEIRAFNEQHVFLSRILLIVGIIFIFIIFFI